ncbi:ubiC [Klebsiella pneumoniae]|nr:Chorismate--pyruvate lyase [Klebsiella pneumoniae 30684/NJST258_2]AHM87565.1 Chorismate--pyruvate lyase [Klebsiella pneumoniae 30660/NJST258_1]BAH61178.1 chorismate lyase [Klebsiella pneumoniae subsp. pneumoniae NTUH-K2044]CDQ53066.1 ubiC [Klebsiella pneumoniae]
MHPPGCTFFCTRGSLLHGCCVNDRILTFARHQPPILRYNAFTLCTGESGMSHPALTRLRALRYFAVMPSLPPPLSDWLLLEDSMTQRFEQQGKQVTVTLVNEGYIGRDALTDEAALLPDEPRYWLREIILNADGEPWLAGRTVAPESTLCGPELALQQLGQTPLGRYLFTSSTLTRDFIEIGRDAALWGRRSRLRLSGKPLLLTELFLPASPLY